jgi:hypothetical protein
MSTSLIFGLTLGAFSWAIVPLVSGEFEPFDSEIGFYTGQVMLAAAAFYLGFSRGMKQLLVYIVGVYIGCIVYAYAFGSSDTRAWILVGLITTWGLCIFPLLSGIFGKLVSNGKKKYSKRMQSDAAKLRR